MATETRDGPAAALVGHEYRIVCENCDIETIHLAVISAEYTYNWGDGDFGVTAWNDYQVVECQGCRTLAFRMASRNSEEMDGDPRSDQLFFVDKVEVYPPRQKGRRGIRNDELYSLPKAIRLIYRETLSAIRSGLPILASIGLRAIVETVCADRQAKGRNLQERIADLVTQHVMTPAGAEILHSLRAMGNDAAHEVKSASDDSLNTACDVVEHLLQSVYLLPERAKKLPKAH